MVDADVLLPELWADESWGASLDDDARADLIAGVEAWLPPKAQLQEDTAQRLRHALLVLGEQSHALAQGHLDARALVALCLAALGAKTGASY